MKTKSETVIPELVSKRQMRLMLDAIPGRIWFMDRDHRVRFANREAAALFHLQPEDVIGRCVSSLTGKDSFTKDKPYREEAIAGRVASWEGWSVYPDGEERYTERIFNPHFNRQGKIDGYYEFVRDVTELKQAEREQRRSSELMQDAIESLSEGFALFDSEDRLVMCNSRFRELNRPADDILIPGNTWQDITRYRIAAGLFPEAVGREDKWLSERARRRREMADDELTLANGRIIHASHRRTYNGGTVHVWRDISERRRMEQDLRASDELVRQVHEACPVVLSMNRVDDGVILYESPAAQVLLRYEESQVGRSVIPRWIHGKDRDAYLAKLKRDGAVDSLPIRYKRADGEEFWCAISSRLVEYRGEQVIVSNLFDLTERYEAEAELTRQRELLHQSEKLSALGELLAGVAHELNNPLSVLVGQALMLRDDAADERTAARAEKIRKAADRCARIVKTFLAMARQEPSKMEAVELNTVIESALDVTAYMLRSADIDVSLRLTRDLPMVTADADQLHQVFTNLIVNAQNALESQEGPRRLKITSTYRRKTDQVVIKIKDNGPGVSSDIASRIFEPLFTTKDVGSGTGMGLAICHRIVEAHGGTIMLETAQGEGAVFSVRLPRAGRSARQEIVRSRTDATRSGHSVLVVDDDYDVGQTISDVLEHQGYQVEIVSSGAVALEKVKRQRYDAILSDVRMPGMDGPALYRALSAERPQQIDGLAFITGDTLTPGVRQFLETSERPYLEKPILPHDVRELMELLMRRKAQ